MLLAESAESIYQFDEGHKTPLDYAWRNQSDCLISITGSAVITKPQVVTVNRLPYYANHKLDLSLVTLFSCDTSNSSIYVLCNAN